MIRTILTIIMVLAPLQLLAPTVDREIFLGDRFAARYNHWAMIRTQRQPGLIDASEIRAWHETQQAWKALNREVQY